MIGRADYAAEDFVLLRAAAEPVETYVQLLAGAPDDESLLRALVKWVDDPVIGLALAVASPDLHAGLSRLQESGVADTGRRSKQVKRIRSRLLRYLSRMSSRATPFGTFAGVAWGRLADVDASPSMPPASRWVHRVRPDMGWVLDLVKRIEDCGELREDLVVIPNSLIHRSGDRIFLPVADVHGSEDLRHVNVAATPALLDALLVLQERCTYGELIAALGARYPEDPTETITGFVAELWALHLLTSDLRPSLARPDPSRHLATQLAAHPAAGDPGHPGHATASELLGGLATVHELSAEPVDVQRLDRLRAAQRALAPEYLSATLQVDAAMGQEVMPLAAGIGARVAVAYSDLARFSPRHAQRPYLDAYRAAFTERYGAGALVPAVELLSPDSGLGPPQTYSSPPRTFELEGVGEIGPESTDAHRAYDALLTELMLESIRAGVDHLELTDERVNRLSRLAAGDRELPLYPVVDAYVQVLSTVAGEDWLVVRDDTFAPGGRTFGRFYDILPEEAVTDLRRLAAAWTEDRPEAVLAELCYLPTSGHAANVALRPLLTEHEVALNAAPSVAPERRLELGELEVGVTESRFYLWSRRLGREVIVIQSHMLNEQMAPNIARFLLEASNDGYFLPSGFSWGALEQLPALPRVVRHGVVLRPACWSLSAQLLTDCGGPDATDLGRVAAWRDRYAVPRWVYAVDLDNRLLLDLTHPACVAELRELLRMQSDPEHSQGESGPGTLTIQEMVPAADELWLADEGGRRYVSEVIVPLRKTRDAVAPSPARMPGPVSTVERYLPGSSWTYLCLYANPDQQDSILRLHLAGFGAELIDAQVCDRWFFIRYLDPRPHLRLRFRAASPETTAEQLVQAVGFAHAMVDLHLATHFSLLPFAPEQARYGGPRVYDAIESTFQTTSAMVPRLIALSTDGGGTLEREHVAVATLIAMYLQWGVPWEDLADAMPSGTPSDRVRAYFRSHRGVLVQLVCSLDPVLAARLGGGEPPADSAELVVDLSSAAESFARAGRVVREAAQREDLSGDEVTVISSLAHMTVNRLLPIDLDREADLYFLVQEVLRTVRGRVAAARREESDG